MCMCVLLVFKGGHNVLLYCVCVQVAELVFLLLQLVRR